MGNGNAWIFIVVVLVVAAAITAAVTYFLTRSLAEKFRKEQQERSDNIVCLLYTSPSPRDS